MEHEITKRIPLLSEDGELNQQGYAVKAFPAYRRSDIMAGRTLLHERDSYFFCNGKLAALVSILRGFKGGSDSITLVDLEKRTAASKNPLCVFPFDRFMPESSASGDSSSSGKGYGIYFKNDGKKRIVVAHAEHLGDFGSVYIRALIDKVPEFSFVTALPADGDKCFRYSQVLTPMRASGEICLGAEVIEFSGEDTFAIMNWERGAWKKRNSLWRCYAAGCAGGCELGLTLCSGVISGISENMIFVDGQCIKLGALTMTAISGPENKVAMSGTGFGIEFTALLEQCDRQVVGLRLERCRRQYGTFSGTVELGNGTSVDFDNLYGYMERIE